MQSSLRLTTRVASVTVLCSVVGALLAVGFNAGIVPAVPMFAAFGGVMTAIYHRDSALPAGEQKAE